MTVDAIRADLDAQRNPQAHLHIAIENWHHDFNIGSVVRTANAFNVAGVHIVGKRKWNRRGAMVTERYLHVQHHETPQHLQEWAGTLPIVGIDNVPGSLPIESATLPATGILVFGQESTGLTPAMQEACQQILHITQYGSTRSMNAGAAAAIAMYQWSTSHRKCVAS
jgi:tRNA G18 (ribose-2'-O)-methylase SpoU